MQRLLYFFKNNPVVTEQLLIENGFDPETIALDEAQMIYNLSTNGLSAGGYDIIINSQRWEQLSTLFGLAALQAQGAYSASGNAVRMDGAWNAQKGFETPDGEFSPFKLNHPIIGNKLEYAFGNATGSNHNVSRSMQNENNLNSIGIFDNKEGRSLMTQYIEDAYRQRNYGVLQENGRISVNTLVTGPNGFLNMETIWDGEKLITINTYKTYWNTIAN